MIEQIKVIKELFSKDGMEKLSSSIDAVTKSFTEVYKTVQYTGYVSIFGGLMVVLTPLFHFVPMVQLERSEEELFVYAGLILIGLGALSLIAYNLVFMKMEMHRRELHVRIFEAELNSVKIAFDKVAENSAAAARTAQEVVGGSAVVAPPGWPAAQSGGGGLKGT